ncbi:MAG: hypothetical protein LBU83_02720, partial [Bacteroidales bacterium]|nr:hypothetical protein [Bacteroidales bacterium]
MKIKQLFFLLLLFLTLLSVCAQNTKFDTLANEINRISLYKKTKSLEMLQRLYKMAYNSPDSSLLIDRCL